MVAGGAFYQGVPVNPSWDNSWTVGRGQFGGGPADWFDGIIDEVRISNTALPPSQFLFAPAGPALLGDYNDNGKVDAADYVVWRKTNINGPQGYIDLAGQLWRDGPRWRCRNSRARTHSFVLCSLVVGAFGIMCRTR